MVTGIGHDSLKTRRTLEAGGKRYDYYSLPAAAEALGVDVSSLPFSLKVLLENMLRFEDGRTVTVEHVRAFADWLKDRTSTAEIAYRPARVLMQDFTGVPAVADLAAMRDAMAALGGDPQKINPLSPVDLVIDHSVSVDVFADPDAFKRNVELEFERNRERYTFLRWGQTAFNNFRVVPPGTGICHQVNLEYLARVTWTSEDPNGKTVAYPDTVVGTDSHTTMINGLGVLGWGVGGIEAEAGMLGQPVSMVIPDVVGFELTGAPAEGVTATDVVLTVVQMLRKKGVVQKFVEFYGAGVAHLGLADRATIANMTPEFGATCGIFPIDEETIRFMRFTGRDDAQVALTEAYAKAQGMWRGKDWAPVFSDTLSLDLSTVEPSLAGPKRPQDRVALSGVAESATKALADLAAIAGNSGAADRSAPVAGADYAVSDADVVIAAITSCTNTSNPSVLVAAGLVAKKANERGLKAKPWVKTSFAPGSQVVSDYMEAAGLQTHLDAVGFGLVGYGCTTCIGNSGPLPEPIHNAIEENDLAVAAVLSGNRNFEGRVHPLTKLNYLASPPLVVAYAIAGTLKKNLVTEPLGQDQNGKDVFLKDIWPSNREVRETLEASLTPQMFRSRYADVAEGPAPWRQIQVRESETYNWDAGSTYVQQPPFFDGMTMELPPVHDVRGARILAMLADSVTTDHISPAGSIKKDSPAADFLMEHQVRPQDFNVLGARRGNHNVMARATFANIRIRNEVAAGTEGGVTKHYPSGDILPMFTAAERYAREGVPLVIFAGKEYGTGSSRDWAAKGPRLLGVQAVVSESFERIHRSNLVGMGVLPLEFKPGTTRQTLGLKGDEIVDITGVEAGIKPRMDVTCTIRRADGSVETLPLTCRIDTLDEVEYYRHGGILQYVLRNLIQAAKAA
ncbi:MAG: aconitate hydratase AcnA [Alphaproteobacteria bacterium]